MASSYFSDSARKHQTANVANHAHKSFTVVNRTGCAVQFSCLTRVRELLARPFGAHPKFKERHHLTERWREWQGLFYIFLQKVLDKVLASCFNDCKMKEKQTMANKLRELKRGQSFTVANESQRQSVCRIAKALKDAGYLPFKIVTRKEGDTFKVAAI